LSATSIAFVSRRDWSKLIANELYGGQTPSPAASKAVKEIKDYCSQRL
jgi:hypothetical protein